MPPVRISVFPSADFVANVARSILVPSGRRNGFSVWLNNNQPFITLAPYGEPISATAGFAPGFVTVGEGTLFVATRANFGDLVMRGWNVFLTSVLTSFFVTETFDP